MSEVYKKVGINPGVKALDVINSIKKNDANASVVIKNSSGKEITDEFVGTGSSILISEGSYKLSVLVTIYGDASGDGKINALDLLKIQKHILGVNKFDGAFLIGADSSKDGKVNSLDLLKIQKHILGVNTIGQ